MGQERLRDIHIVQLAADHAAHVVMLIGTRIEAAGLVAKRKFQNQAMLGEEVQRPIDRTERDGRMLLTDDLIDLGSC